MVKKLEWKLSADITGFSGKLVSLQRPDESIGGQGPTLLTILFGNKLMEVSVDFAVENLSHSEFQVRVLAERRKALKTVREMCTCLSARMPTPRLRDVYIEPQGDRYVATAIVQPTVEAVMSPQDAALWKASQQKVAASKYAIGRVRTADLIDGVSSSSAWRAARAAFDRRPSCGTTPRGRPLSCR